MSQLVKKAFSELFPEKTADFDATLKYSASFKGYNAKVRYTRQSMEFRLSRSWKEVSEEIQIGLIQSLLNKIYKTCRNTVNIDLYNIFLKKVPSFVPKTKTDPIMEESFSRVNEEYFGGIMLRPNLEFGGKNLHTLGTYDHGTDTIRISEVLKKDLHLMDYVMYHEMLHKKFKYKTTAKKTIHHSRQFRQEEKKFSDPEIEKKLSSFLKKERFRKSFFHI